MAHAAKTKNETGDRGETDDFQIGEVHVYHCLFRVGHSFSDCFERYISCTFKFYDFLLFSDSKLYTVQELISYTLASQFPFWSLSMAFRHGLSLTSDICIPR